MAMLYSDKHVRVHQERDCVILSLSEYAIKELKTIVFINLPDIGEKMEEGTPFGDIESIKTVSDLIAPVGGEIVEVNERLYDEPESLTADEWLVKVSDFRLNEKILMTEEEYGKYVESL